jgi:endonuclease/exonuclease/phosphatase (EEP) superfamily protein YafD
MKITRRGVEDTIKENKEECMLMGGDFNGRI